MLNVLNVLNVSNVSEFEVSGYLMSFMLKCLSFSEFHQNVDYVSNVNIV